MNTLPKCNLQKMKITKFTFKDLCNFGNFILIDKFKFSNVNILERLLNTLPKCNLQKMKITKFTFKDLCNFGNFILKINLNLATLTFWKDF